MISPIRSFNVKVLGWFWLTLLVSVLSIAIPAVLIQQFSDENHLQGQDRDLLNAMVSRVDTLIADSNGDYRRLGRMLNKSDRRMPFEWFVINNELEIVLSSAPLRKSLRERFETRVSGTFCKAITCAILTWNGPAYLARAFCHRGLNLS